MEVDELNENSPPGCSSFKMEKIEDSGLEAPTLTESDKESAEDSSSTGAKEVLHAKKAFRHSSSFIQNILYEDSCTGVAVVDLFIALKLMKKNLEFLSKSNEKLSDYMNNLNEETNVIWKGFMELFEAIRALLDKMNADASTFNLKKLQNAENEANEIEQKGWTLKIAQEKLKNIKSTHDSLFPKKNLKKESKRPKFQCESLLKKDSDKCENKDACSECGRDLNEVSENENKKRSCLGCIISTFKEKSLSQFLVSPEAFFGPVLASLFNRQTEQGKEKKSSGPSKSSKGSSSTLEERISDRSLNIKESTVQMICDICEILNVATVREMEVQEPLPLKPTVRLESVSCAPSSKNRKETHEEMNHQTSGVSAENGCLHSEGRNDKNSAGECSKEAVESKDELTSEEDSDFEEALSCQLNPSVHHDLRAEPNVTCMGDLSKAVAGKKSASTLTPENNIVSSWTRKLSDEIRSKIKQIKSKRNNKTNIEVFEQPFEKSETKKCPGTLQFTVTASTPAGVFDVTVIQYKKKRCLTESAVNYKKPLDQCTPVPELTNGCHLSPLILNYNDKDWSEESLPNSDLERIETCSNLGDDELGEFLEIYVQNNENGKRENETKKSEKSQIIGVLNEFELKKCKSHIFKFERSYPVYFMQEFKKKTEVSKENEDSESENLSEEEIFSLNSGEKQQKEIVIQGSSSELVIYIQVEIEDDSGQNPGGLVLDYKTSSLGTQTEEDNSETVSFSLEKAIKLNEDERKGESLYNIWKAHETNQNLDVEDMERITFDEPFVVLEKPEVELEEEREGKKWSEAQERVVNVKEPKEKTVTFRENRSEIFEEKEIQDTFLEEEKEEVKEMGRAVVLSFLEMKQSAQIWYFQIERLKRTEMLRLKQKPKDAKEIMESINTNNGELKKAFQLIREIENDIADAQIDDAISILPRLEMELRKHLQSKIKGLEEKKTKDATSEAFFSSSDFRRRDESIEGVSNESSEFRFKNLLKLLSSLEDAVKANENSSNYELCRESSSKIYKLLHALTVSIRELEEEPDITSLSQTLEIASQLDTAVREYDSIVKKQPLDYLIPQEKSRKRRKPRWNSSEQASVSQHLKNVRKKVFEMVGVEAVGMEERIQRDFDRLDQLGTENDEALTFLEALLQKTQRRVSEFESLKEELKQLSSTLNDMYENLKSKLAVKEEKKIQAEKPPVETKQSAIETPPINQPNDLSQPLEKETVRETVSGLVNALNDLKSKSTEKSEIKEIFPFTNTEKLQTYESESPSQRSSKSSFTSKQVNQLISSINKVTVIGQSSLYLSWMKPAGSLEDSIVGYEIYVNEKLNQKVRNPKRLQAILYSVDLSQKIQLQLYAVVENNPKILIATSDLKSD